MANKFQSLLQKILGIPTDVPAKDVISLQNQVKHFTEEELDKFRRMGVVFTDLGKVVQDQSIINFERTSVYREADKAAYHPIIGAALEYYADTVTNYDRVQNSTVWVTSESKEYTQQLEKLLDIINVEERIFDWAYTTGLYGDLFVKVNARPGVGIVSIEDDDNPINVSRVDYEGKLIGFFKTPQGMTGSSTETATLISPWDYVHFRLLGVKRKRSLYNNPTYSDYRNLTLLAPDTRQISAKYGTPLILNALPIYKRLRLTEDSIMLARLSKSTLKYIYKVKVDGSNAEAVQALVEQYKVLLKRARSMDTGVQDPFFADGQKEMLAVEDLIIPVFGDTNNLTIDKIGGEPDIKWIADLTELRNQLAIALRIPLQLLGGYVDELPGSLGKSSAENLDIRFARSARRLQRSVIEGIKRICQIHLSYLNMSPDPKMFDINMAETSTAEESEIRDNLDKSSDTVEKMCKLMVEYGPTDISREKMLDYFNTKLLKLNDLKMSDMRTVQITAGPVGESKVKEVKKKVIVDENSDLTAYLPGTPSNYSLNEEKWKKNFGTFKIQIAPQAKT